MPPSIVLEVLRILKEEVDLRELTRTTEQRKEVQDAKEYDEAAAKLATTQGDLHERTRKVIASVEKLQREKKKKFGQALQRLAKAESAMGDAARVLGEPDTGGPAIAAETEAIEALLATKRGGGGGGGGGGSNPGGNTGGGETDLAAVSLIGVGVGEEADSRLIKQAAGSAGAALPDEFRDGLDAYFGALEDGE